MTVFTPNKIGNLEISNRLVRSATTEFLTSETGHVTDELIRVYENLARGGVGLTISAVSNVREDGKQILKMIGNYSDDYLEDLTKIAGAYHDIANEVGNESRIFLQIGHCGAEVTPLAGWSGELISSTSHENIMTHQKARTLEVEEIIELIELFSQAIERAKKAGFDGVQLHGAHGYLITQFYSPFFNKREDEYGGSTENRARFVLDILTSSRKKVGNNFPITIKMNGSDRIEGGVNMVESARLATLFARGGFDSLEISSYIKHAERLSKQRILSMPPEAQTNVRKRGIEAFNLDLAKNIKSALKQDPLTNIPIILVGGLYRFENIQSIIQNEDIEFCAMSRPLISQPNLPNIWKAGPPFPEADCIHCNACVRTFNKGKRSKGIRCIHKEKLAKKKKVL